MRNVVGLAATLAALVFMVTPARAEIPVKAPRLHVTNILSRSQQALVFDVTRNEYQLLKVGQRTGAFTVMEITEDFVVLGSTQRRGFYFVLSLPKALPPPPAELAPLIAPPATPSTPQDPYAPTGDGTLDPTIDMPNTLDPYAPNPAAPATPLDPYSAVRPSPPPYQISRGELQQTLSDFQALEREIQIQSTEQGVQVVGLSTGSFLHRIGLRQGDLILRVAGQPVNSNEGAASAYATVSSGRPFDVVVQRYGREVTLRYEMTG